MSWNRRELLGAAWGAMGAGAAIALGLAPLGCAGAPEEAFAEALRTWLGDDAGARRVAAAAGTRREAALQVLRGDADDALLRRAASDPEALRALVKRRVDADLGAGRTRLVEGWRLAESEIAVAVVAAR